MMSLFVKPRSVLFTSIFISREKVHQSKTISYSNSDIFWFCLSGNMYKTLNEWTHVINAVKWSPDETLLCAVGPYELVILYDTVTWEELHKFEGHLHSVVDCAFSSDR